MLTTGAILKENLRFMTGNWRYGAHLLELLELLAQSGRCGCYQQYGNGGDGWT
jgi:hypothetical protein